MKFRNILFCLMILLPISFVSCRSPENNTINPVAKAYEKHINDPNNYTVLLGHAEGTSYGWNFCFFKVVGVSYSEAVKNLWKNSSLTPEERSGCTLVNVKKHKGTYWSVLVTGQTYMTVTADVVKLKK